MKLILLALGLAAPQVESWSLKIICNQGVEICNEGSVNAAIFATVEEATAEADRISLSGCWMDEIKLNCTSVRSVESFDKLTPGGIQSIALRRAQH